MFGRSYFASLFEALTAARLRFQRAIETDEFSAYIAHSHRFRLQTRKTHGRRDASLKARANRRKTR